MAEVVKVDGLRELLQAWERLPEAVQGKVAYSAVGSGANVIKKEAILLAPEASEPHVIDGVTVQPGNLKRNIVSKRVRDQEQQGIYKQIVTVRGKRKHGYASRYGSMKEFGTSKMAADPYMRPAFEAKRMEAVERIKVRLGKSIENTVRKLNRGRR